ncbi:MAG: bacterial transcriptional activator domain-containing protein [Chloroflexota bacterium]
MKWRDKLTRTTHDDIQNALSEHHVLIIYPQVTYRTLYLSAILDAAGDATILYYRHKSSVTNLLDCLRSFLDELQAQHDDFGGATRTALDNNTGSVELAQALCTDLATMGDCVLYMDDLDGLEITPAYEEFFTTLVTNVPDNCRLIVSARELRANPWQTLVLEGHAGVLGTERVGSSLMFTSENADRPQLEIYGFGRGHAIINGKPVESWDGALPRNLFFYFIDNELVTRDEVFSAFWSSLNQKEATNVFHVTKRKISERLSDNVFDGENYELTSYGTGFYRPSDKINRHYDVAMFEDAIEEATMTFNDDKQAALYQRAVDIYQSPFLLTIDMEWVHERRKKLQRSLIEALIGLARYHKDKGNTEKSLGYFTRALREAPMREDIHREIMRLYKELGYIEDARQQYERLATRLQDELGIAPGPETQELWQSLS